MKKRIAQIICLFFFLQLAVFAGQNALAGGSSTNTVNFSNPLQYDTVEGVLANVLNVMQGIIVTLSLVFIVVGAVMYVVSGGNEGMIKTAKSAILAALIGLAIGIAAPSFLQAIYDILGATPCDKITDAASRAACEAQLDSAPSLSKIAMNALNFLLGIVGTLALVSMVVGAIMIFGASADEKSMEKGKSIVKYSIIGITVALASLVIVKQIANLLAS